MLCCWYIFFYQAVKNNIRIYENMRKIATVQVDYTTVCVFNYPYYKENYKLVAIDLTKQQALDVQKHYNKLISLEM